jgi:phosphoribosylformimino-5-aminoimidazole carboxamide ribotide isomerase
MDIIPGIDIRGGRCVRLVQGDYARETVFADDPVAVAQQWQLRGARRVHVVDLDGARERRPVNDAIIERIIAETSLRVQVAGGMGDRATVERWLASRADRVVVGTLAVEKPKIIADLAGEHADRLAIALDARDGKVAVKGWLDTSATPVEAFCRDMASLGIRHFIYTDIGRDGTMSAPNFDAVAPLLAAIRAERDDATLVYSGGISRIEDIVELAEHDLEGVIVGRALYDGTVDLRAANRALSVGDDW